MLFGLVAFQALIFAAVVLAFRPLDASTGDYAKLLALLVATGFVAVSMGLAISAFVSSEDQATSLTPLAVIPQLLFAGAIVPLERMGPVVEAIPYAMFSQWSFASVGTAADMNGRIAEHPEFSRINPFGTDFFDVSFADWPACPRHLPVRLHGRHAGAAEPHGQAMTSVAAHDSRADFLQVVPIFARLGGEMRTAIAERATWVRVLGRRMADAPGRGGRLLSTWSARGGSRSCSSARARKSYASSRAAR